MLNRVWLAAMATVQVTFGSVALGAETTSVVPRLQRPASGEWLGIYLLGHKAGYSFSQITRSSGPEGAIVTATEDTTLHANVGGQVVTRRVKEIKRYWDRPNGPLISLEAMHSGDGGDDVVTGRFDGAGAHITRTRKGGVAEKLELPRTREVVEDADLVRLCATTHKRLTGYLFDSTTLSDKLNVAEDLGPGELLAGGSRAKVEKIAVTEDEGKIAAETSLSRADGRILQMRFGGALIAVPEPKAVAQKLDTIDLFALTRVAVDRALPVGIVPATVVYRIDGLPPAVRPESNRQTYRDLPGGAVELTVRAAAPKVSAKRPLDAPAEELKATPAIESTDPAIVKLAVQIVAGESDASTAAIKLSQWVFSNVQNAYGVSSDRATDVLRRKEGDCTEHSLLLTALARAAGIPARLVHGLVYARGADGAPGLYWHEWVEVYVGEWTAVDPTFGQSVADATHVQLGRGDQTDAVALMGQLKVSVVSADPPREDRDAAGRGNRANSP